MEIGEGENSRRMQREHNAREVRNREGNLEMKERKIGNELQREKGMD